jgi:hypothetical protein
VFINATLTRILAIPDAFLDPNLSGVYTTLALTRNYLEASDFERGIGAHYFRIGLDHFNTHGGPGSGSGVDTLYEVSQDKKGIDGFLSWVRSEIERIDGPPPPPVGGRRRSRRSRRANRKSRRGQRKSRRANMKSRRANRKSRRANRKSRY